MKIKLKPPLKPGRKDSSEYHSSDCCCKACRKRITLRYLAKMKPDSLEIPHGCNCSAKPYGHSAHLDELDDFNALLRSHQFKYRGNDIDTNRDNDSPQPTYKYGGE